MKIPRIFLLERSFDDKIESLKRPPKKRNVRSLQDLILENDLECSDFVRYEKVPAFDKTYSFLNKSDIMDSACVDYDESVVDILEFRDETTLKRNMPNIVACISQFNNKSKFSDGHVLVKEAYAIFIYTTLGSYYTRREFTNAYKKKFGFKEVRVD